jgi:site-specific DNA-methyltransferase (adenine-specific)
VTATWRILHGDCIEVMATLAEGSVDAVVCDPPYGLGFMGKDWDSPGGTGDYPMRRTTAANTVNTGASRQGGRQRACEDWHKRQLRDARTYQAWCEGWAAEALRVLRPGGYMLAMGGTRTYHRLTSGIEDAGFEIRDTVAWLYGSGFPKHASCLKPAHEPVALARKSGLRSEPLQIEAARIDGPGWAKQDGDSGAGFKTDKFMGGAGRGEPTQAGGFRESQLGRWPANVALDPEAAATLDEQTGTLTSGANPTRRGSDKFRDVYGDFGGQEECVPARGADSGGASRFLYVAKPSAEERNRGLDGFAPTGTTADGYGSIQTPKLDRAAPRENWTPHPVRNPHPTVKPVALMRWLIRLITPADGLVLDPFVGSGTTGMAALRDGFSFVGVEQDAQYVEVARARIIGDAPLLNTVSEVAA